MALGQQRGAGGIHALAGWSPDPAWCHRSEGQTGFGSVSLFVGDPVDLPLVLKTLSQRPGEWGLGGRTYRLDSEAPQLLYMPPWLNGQSKLQSFERIARKARVSLGTSLPGSSRNSRPKVLRALPGHGAGT